MLVSLLNSVVLPRIFVTFSVSDEQAGSIRLKSHGSLNQMQRIGKKERQVLRNHVTCTGASGFLKRIGSRTLSLFILPCLDKMSVKSKYQPESKRQLRTKPFLSLFITFLHDMREYDKANLFLCATSIPGHSRRYQK